MRILIACEESQEVCKAFRAMDHYAFSCDLKPCSGGHPEWHFKCDVREVMNSYDWDMIIAHPPCTDLANSGARWFAEKRADGRQQKSIDFFMIFANHWCPRIAIENPIGIMSNIYRKPDQIINPWQFALSDAENTIKNTCLWLKGLPPLIPYHTERPEISFVSWTDKKTGRIKRQTDWYYHTRCAKHSERGQLASKTFPGIARAMAEQWGR